jgi:hypothetical protein
LIKTILKGIGAAIALFLLIQVVPYGKDRTNPPVLKEPAWDSSRTRELFFRSCKNCHSNETVWPWYSRVAPASWLVRQHVDNGRKNLNVSEWGSRKNKGDEAAEEVREGYMPPLLYSLANPETRLTVAETDELVQGLVKTFGDKKAGARERQ